MSGDNRESFGSWLQFLFSVIGSMVGLGNIWRFPYICHRNGGGAFLIPFCICMAICGLPIGFLEILYCQYSSLGPGKVWIVCPLFKGIWFGMMLSTFVVSMYYTMLMAWILYYLCISFSPTLPWSTCDNHWNTEMCITQDFVLNKSENVINSTIGGNITTVSSQEEYWINQVLDKSSAIDEVGSFRWELILCLIAAWVVTLLCIIKGVEVMGKISYIAATLPYIILTILLIRGVLLPGAGSGVYYLFYPEWHRLLDYTVWRDAATQMFFSAGYGFGVLSTLASYNKFNNNCYRDAMLIPILDTVTSIFASTVIFSYIGYMAHISGKDVDNVIREGPGLVFIAYPSALQTLPLPQLWSVLFFLMLFCTGLDTQFCSIQTLASAVVDAKPKLQDWKAYIMTGLCVVSFMLSLPMTTQGGMYVLHLLDWYVASISFMLLVIVEMLIIGWIYGVDRLYDDIEQMIGYRIPWVFGFSWKYVSPLVLVVIWVTGLAGFEPIGAKYPGYYPWCDDIGLIIAFLPILPIPVLAVTTLCKMEGSWTQRICESLKPAPSWGPAKKTLEGDNGEELEQFVMAENGLGNGHKECPP